MNDLTPGIGHNLPAVPSPETMRELLGEEHAALAGRSAELVGALDRVPPSIEDEPTCAKAADFTKQIQSAIKASEAQREATKAPVLALGKAVDAFFRSISDPLERTKKEVERRMTAYQRRKAEEERQRREEEARRQREEEERLRREAAEKAAAMQTEADLADAVATDTAAQQAAADAAAAEKAAAAKPADLSRTRGDLGAVGSLRLFWDFRNVDRASLDLETLREHLPMTAIEQAIRSYIRAGGRKLAGVEIFENSKTVVS